MRSDGTNGKRVSRREGRRDVRRSVFLCAVLLVAGPSVAFASDDPIVSPESLRWAVDEEPRLDLGVDPPPPSYPLVPVDQAPFHGVRHGLVNTTKGNLVFRVTDLAIRGRTPLEVARVYDSASGTPVAGTVPLVEQGPWTEDLGAGWVLSYSDVLLPTADGVVLVTSDGDRIYWIEGQNGHFERRDECASPHDRLIRESATSIVEERSDGTRWRYELDEERTLRYALAEVVDRSGNTVSLSYDTGYLSRIRNDAGATIVLERSVVDGSPPRTRVTRIEDSTGRVLALAYDAQVDSNQRPDRVEAGANPRQLRRGGHARASTDGGHRVLDSRPDSALHPERSG
jgi:hypothetical protein